MRSKIYLFILLECFYPGEIKSQDFFPLAPGNFWIYDILDEEGLSTGQFGYLINDTFTYDGLLLYDVSFLIPDSTGVISDTLLGPLWFDHPSNPAEIHWYIDQDSSQIFAFHTYSVGTIVQTLLGGGVVMAAGEVSVPAGDFNDCIQVMDATGSGIVFAPDVGMVKVISDGVDVNVLVAYNATQPCALSATAIISHVNCFDGDDGSIATSVMEGTAPFSFEWSGPTAIGNEQNPTRLTSGSYEVTITDNDGCSAILTDLNISEPSAVTITVDNIQNISCAGLSDGAISVSASGGTPGYMYDWDFAADIQNPGGLAPGVYNLTVSDANLCIAIASVTIAKPDSLKANATKTDETALGSEDGTAEVNPSGGTPPYQIIWSNGISESKLDNLAPGSYSVTIEDANGCTVIDSVIINAFQCTLGVGVEVDDPLCAVDSGLVTLIITGENPPVHIVWSSGSPDQVSQFLTAGIHSVVISDSRFCTLVLDFEITEPEPLVIQVDSIGHDLGSDDGFIFTTVSGGTPPYFFNWSDESGPVSVQEDPGDLAAGAYFLTVTDFNGCTAVMDSIVVEFSVAVLRIDFDDDLVFYPNPTPDILYWKSNTPFSPATLLEIFDMYGRKVLQTQLSEGKTDLNGIVSGWYLLKCNISGQTLFGQLLISR